MKKLMLLLTIVFAGLTISCARIDSKRISIIYTDSMVLDCKKLTSSDIDFLLSQVNYILAKDKKLLDDIIEERNPAKRADKILTVESKLHLNELKMACSVLSLTSAKLKMSPEQLNKTEEAESKLRRVKARLNYL